MVSDLVFYQLARIVLIWLFLLLNGLWHGDRTLGWQRPAAPKLPRRTRETKPFASLTHKPYCETYFLKSCDLVFEATSFGEVHTTAERRARWGGDKVPEGFIRLRIGCEDVQDLIEDLQQALDKAYGK